MENKTILKNTVMLYLMTFTKMFLPFFTLPYLTRILSTESYGVISYVKSIMIYVQILVDFGFMLSITKEIVSIKNDRKKMSIICSDTLLSRVILWFISIFIVMIMTMNIKILYNNMLYVFLSMIAVFLTCYLPDYLFRGIEKMEIISYRFIISKVISTILTFVFVKNDNTLIWVPILDIIGNLVAVFLTIHEIKKLHIEIKININRIKFAILTIINSLNYFASNLASTLLGAFSTVLIGIYLLPSDVAFWSVANSLIGTIQSLYNPISDGIYPEMIKTKNILLIRRILSFFLPIVFLGCIISYFVSPYVIYVISGPKYTESIKIFRLMLPILFFSFISIIMGWPSLGAINKNKETMYTTISTAICQIILYFFLIITKNFNIWTIAIVRIICEIILSSQRLLLTLKFKNLFINGGKHEQNI